MRHIHSTHYTILYRIEIIYSVMQGGNGVATILSFLGIYEDWLLERVDLGKLQ